MFWQRLRPWRKTPETDQPATRMSEQDVEELLRELADAPYEELERFGRWLIEVSLGLSRRLDTRAIALVAVIAAALSTLLYRLLPHAPLLTPELGVYLLITTGFLGFAGLNALKVLHLRRHEGFTDTDWFTPKAISSTWGRHNARLLVLWRCWRAHDDSNRERASALTWGYGCFLAGSIVAVYVAFGLAAEPRATIVQMAPNTSDWVSGRHACSTDQAFADLRLQARGNVETRNSEAIRNARREPERRFFFASNGHQFGISRNDGGEVVFTLDGDQIVIEGHGHTVPIVVTTTLDDNGACVLARDNAIGAPWQVLRAALEPLFFGTTPPTVVSIPIRERRRCSGTGGRTQ